MFVGDLIQGIAALIGAIAMYLIVGALVASIVGLGAALLVVAVFLVYAAEVHGGVPLRSKRAES